MSSALVMALVTAGLSALELYLNKPSDKPLTKEEYKAREDALYPKKP